jgi:hypothetical protein
MRKETKIGVSGIRSIEFWSEKRRARGKRDEKTRRKRTDFPPRCENKINCR